MPDLIRIQKVTGGKLTDNVDEITSEFLGSSKLVYTEKMYEKEYAFFTGKQESKAATIILRGGSKLLVDETARGIKRWFISYQRNLQGSTCCLRWRRFRNSSCLSTQNICQRNSNERAACGNSFCRSA